MNIYILTQSTNNDYDTYDSAVVYAEDAESAQLIHPSKFSHAVWDDACEGYMATREDGSRYVVHNTSWVTPDAVTVTLIGKALNDAKAGVVTSSFNAG
jgi:hypothetical protein